ncbi:MAG: dihydroxyacetone kinase subunit DhaK, partial [Chloroflexi bacterium]|nr:dihydroxyacetone kinase subunit DhaK [Chloroflexota bacterium]
MTKLYNDPANFREELIEGFVAAYGRYVRRVPDASGVMAIDAPRPGQVALVIGGGSGHYPAFCGYVGPGLAAAAVMGNVFAAPSAEQIYRVT